MCIRDSFLDGQNEVTEMLETLGISESPILPAAGPTVGSLVEE